MKSLAILIVFFKFCTMEMSIAQATATAKFTTTSAATPTAKFTATSTATAKFTATSTAKSKGIALIYQGPGTCDVDCAEAAAEIPASLGYKIQYISPEDIDAKIFETAVLWIQPGGNAIDAAIAIGSNKLNLIRNFVWNGGAYVGFCAGAFMADEIIEEVPLIKGLGIIPVSSFYEPIDSDFPVGTMAWINWKGKERHVFFNGGAAFNVEKNNTDVKVLARYLLDGAPATIQNHFGRGNVVITGAHPEATYAWKSEYAIEDVDGSDRDLAQGMILEALKQK